MRAFSFAQAISAGYDPRLYRDFVLEGGTAATLDFKIWGKSRLLEVLLHGVRHGQQVYPSYP